MHHLVFDAEKVCIMEIMTVFAVRRNGEKYNSGSTRTTLVYTYVLVPPPAVLSTPSLMRSL